MRSSHKQVMPSQMRACLPVSSQEACLARTVTLIDRDLRHSVCIELKGKHVRSIDPTIMTTLTTLPMLSSVHVHPYSYGGFKRAWRANLANFMMCRKYLHAEHCTWWVFRTNHSIITSGSHDCSQKQSCRSCRATCNCNHWLRQVSGDWLWSGGEADMAA